MTVEQGTFWRNILDPKCTVQTTYVFMFDGPSYICFSHCDGADLRNTLSERDFLNTYEPVTNLEDMAVYLLGHGAI